MRQSLLDLIKNTILFKYELPYSGASIPKTKISIDNDHCFECQDNDHFAEIIYNSIIDYSFNEFDISRSDFDKLHAIALLNKLKYNPSATEEAKIKYGFLGEVVLYSLLYVMFDSPPLIARGYFYNPLENSETKGYDSYHLVEQNEVTELWFGEVKFHKNFKSGIKSVFSNIEKAISDEYLKTNIFAIHNHKSNFNISGSKIEAVLNDWEDNPYLKISEELIQHNMKLIYPIMLLYEDDDEYDEMIRKIPEHIESEYDDFNFSISVDYSIFFILIPLKETKQIKQKVIQWIESKKQLMS